MNVGSRAIGRTNAQLELAKDLAEKGHQVVYVAANTRHATLIRRLAHKDVRVVTPHDPSVDLVNLSMVGQDLAMLVDHFTYECELQAAMGKIAQYREDVERLRGALKSQDRRIAAAKQALM